MRVDLETLLTDSWLKKNRLGLYQISQRKKGEIINSRRRKSNSGTPEHFSSSSISRIWPTVFLHIAYQISQRKGGDIINSRRSRQSNIRHSQELPAFRAFSSTHINLSQLSKICSANILQGILRGILMSNISPFFTPAQLKTMKAWGDVGESTHLSTITMIS